MLFSQCCSWFRSPPSPSPFWTQRCLIVLFDDFTWFAMVSSQVPFLSQDWETWKKPCHILIQVENLKSQKSLAKTHAPVPGCEGQSRSGGSHSQMCTWFPHPSSKKNGITLIDQKVIHHEFWKYPTSYCCSISLFVYIFFHVPWAKVTCPWTWMMQTSSSRCQGSRQPCNRQVMAVIYKYHNYQFFQQIHIIYVYIYSNYIIHILINILYYLIQIS